MAKKTIYFHIGTHKTGSTAIQKFLLDNQKILHDFNFNYNEYISNGINHMELSHKVELWDNINLNPKSNYIFSSEDFYYSFFQEQKNINILNVLKRNKDKFRNHNIKIIIYLRRQDLFLESLNNEIIKRHGFFGKFSESIVSMDYEKALSQIADILGKGNLIIRPYEKRQFLNNNILDDFLSILGLDLTDEYKIEKRVINPSLTTEKMEFTRYINMLDLPIGFRTQISRLIINSTLNSNEATLFRKQGLISPQEAKTLLEKYKEGNEKIAKEFLGRENGKLFYDEVVEDQNWKPFPGLDSKIAREILSQINNMDAKVLETLYKHICTQTEKTEEFIKAANFLTPLLIETLKIETNFEALVIDNVSKTNLFKKLQNIASNEFDSADILRDVAIAFESINDIQTAKKVMQQAHLLRPDGPVIKKKLDEYNKLLVHN